MVSQSTIRVAIAIVLAAVISSSAAAHPSVGIVVAPNGDVFYSDLTQVWRITRTGKKHVVVPNVHTHELFIDAAGTLFGEDSKWLGGDRYRHRIWKRTANGQITDVVPWTDGFWREFGFTRDAAGAMYWVKCSPTRVCTILKRDQNNRIGEVVSFNGPINWIKATAAGHVYVVDRAYLRRATRKGTVETVARISSGAGGRHDLMGMTLDSAGNVYVAAHADRAVVRVTPAGQVRRVARSAAPWAPSGIAISPTGELWILEWAGSQTRVRHVARNGTTIY